MSNEELTNWLLNKFDLCYEVKLDYYPDSIFWFYDEKFIRYIKLCKLNNKKIKQNRNSDYIPINSICLFRMDINTNHFYCDFIIIEKFEETYNLYSYEELINIILNILKKHNKLFNIQDKNIINDKR